MPQVLPIAWMLTNLVYFACQESNQEFNFDYSQNLACEISQFKEPFVKISLKSSHQYKFK